MYSIKQGKNIQNYILQELVKSIFRFAKSNTVHKARMNWESLTKIVIILDAVGRRHLDRLILRTEKEQKY